eukprot:jgi/Mesen1/2544/ME000161S01593
MCSTSVLFKNDCTTLFLGLPASRQKTSSLKALHRNKRNETGINHVARLSYVAVATSSSPSITNKNRNMRCRASKSSRQSSESRLDAKVVEIMEILKGDLPDQYQKEMDWSIYDSSVIFVDPVTRLKGKLPYRGMIFTLRWLTSGLFEEATATFELFSIQEVDKGAATTSAYGPKDLGQRVECKRAIRTVWATRGTTRWGKLFEITGDDIFRVDKNGKLVTHESAWNEAPSQVWADFRPFS